MDMFKEYDKLVNDACNLEYALRNRLDTSTNHIEHNLFANMVQLQGLSDDPSEWLLDSHLPKDTPIEDLIHLGSLVLGVCTDLVLLDTRPEENEVYQHYLGELQRWMIHNFALDKAHPTDDELWGQLHASVAKQYRECWHAYSINALSGQWVFERMCDYLTVPENYNAHRVLATKRSIAYSRADGIRIIYLSSITNPFGDELAATGEGIIAFDVTAPTVLNRLSTGF